MFAHIMGVNVSQQALIPSSTSTLIKWNSGLLNQSWLNGTPTHKVVITSNTQVANAVFAWGGDLDWSHSTDPVVIAQNITSRTTPLGSYSAKTLEDVNLSVSSTLTDGKVVLTTNLTKEGLAGLQVIMNYDNTKLQLDNIIFDTGNTITNFSTDKDGRLTVGSIDQLKTARIKKGTPYKLIFTPKVPLTNTAGLFFFVLSDAVDATGKKVNLIVE
jgi:hypothetical protein